MKSLGIWFWRLLSLACDVNLNIAPGFFLPSPPPTDFLDMPGREMPVRGQKTFVRLGTDTEDYDVGL